MNYLTKCNTYSLLVPCEILVYLFGIQRVKSSLSVIHTLDNGRRSDHLCFFHKPQGHRLLAEPLHKQQPRVQQKTQKLVLLKIIYNVNICRASYCFSVDLFTSCHCLERDLYCEVLTFSGWHVCAKGVVNNWLSIISSSCVVHNHCTSRTSSNKKQLMTNRELFLSKLKKASILLRRRCYNNVLAQWYMIIKSTCYQ